MKTVNRILSSKPDKSVFFFVFLAWPSTFGELNWSSLSSQAVNLELQKASTPSTEVFGLTTAASAGGLWHCSTLAPHYPITTACDRRPEESHRWSWNKHVLVTLSYTYIHTFIYTVFKCILYLVMIWSRFWIKSTSRRCPHCWGLVSPEPIDRCSTS